MLEDGRPKRQVLEFAVDISGPEKPLIIGERAVNLWAQVYSARTAGEAAARPAAPRRSPRLRPWATAEN